MLLCDVALGNMHNLDKAEYIEKLPKDKHSVQGIGRQGPNYDQSLILPNGATIPNGKVMNNELPAEMVQNFVPT